VAKTTPIWAMWLPPKGRKASSTKASVTSRASNIAPNNRTVGDISIPDMGEPLLFCIECSDASGNDLNISSMKY
jgi:hypothetical protein